MNQVYYDQGSTVTTTVAGVPSDATATTAAATPQTAAILGNNDTQGQQQHDGGMEMQSDRHGTEPLRNDDTGYPLPTGTPRHASMDRRRMSVDSSVYGTPTANIPASIQRAKPSATQTSSASGSGNDELYTATYSGIPVFEIMVNGVAVMRRRHDSCLNATQILKVAGVEKSKRTKVLEKEILIGEHEKVQGGYGKYQGTWIPFQRGTDLCRQYGVYELLLPLLQFDGQNQMEHTPTKEQAMAARRKRTITESTGSGANLSQSTKKSLANSLQTFSHPLQVSVTNGFQLSHHATSALSTLGRATHMAGRQDTLMDSNSNSIHESIVRDDSHVIKRPRIDFEPPLDDESLPDLIAPLDPLDPNYTDMNLAHVITRLFIAREHEDIDPVSVLISMPEINRDTVDIPIDDSGHAALHWASALAMAPLVRELVRRGANQQRGNYAGESTLVRAVLVTNSFESATFPLLLESLYPAIPLIDKHGRTVLHHIALTAGIKGRSGASKYYLESLLEWIVKRGSKGKRKRYGLERFMRDVVNVQDKNGDTALNIAARVGNKSIAQQLMDVGANPHLANRAGLKPTDFGILYPGKSVNNLNTDSPNGAATEQGGNGSNTTTTSAEKQDSSSTVANTNDTAAQLAAEKRRQTIGAIQNMVSQLDTDFDQELEAKQKQIESMHTQLHETTATLTQRRERLETVRGLSNKLVESQRSAANLDRAIQEEDSLFKQQSGDLNFDQVDFDADQPFVVDELQGVPPAAVLRARIAAYRRNENRLQGLGQDLKLRSDALEQKFRKVVALCTGVEEAQADQLVEGLVQAVQSDRDDMDIDRVAGFLRKIDRTHTGGVVV